MMSVTRYETAIGLIGEGGRLHVMYGHATAYGMSWCPICRLDSGCQSRAMPLYAPDMALVSCKRCRAVYRSILMDRRRI